MPAEYTKIKQECKSKAFLLSDEINLIQSAPGESCTWPWEVYILTNGYILLHKKFFAEISEKLFLFFKPVDILHSEDKTLKQENYCFLDLIYHKTLPL